MTSSNILRQPTACLSTIRTRIVGDCVSCNKVSRFCSSVDETLRAIPILRDLHPDWVAQGCVCNSFSSNEIVFSQSDESSDVFFIVRGRVRLVAYSTSGKEVIYREIEAGQMFGELSAIDGQIRSATAISLGNSRLIRMSQGNFKKLLQENRGITKSVLLHLANRVRSLSQRVFELSTMSVNDRLHAELLRLAESHGEFAERAVTILPAPTHSELANRISTHREAVTRELNRLRRIGAISLEKGRITINDRRFAKSI